MPNYIVMVITENTMSFTCNIKFEFYIRKRSSYIKDIMVF